MASASKKSATPDSDAGGAPLRILALLQLNRVAIADQLLHSIKRFRPAQVLQLLSLLEALQAQSALENVTAHFDRKLDVKDEMERYLHDVLKMHHYITHHNVDPALSSLMMQLYGAFGDGADRQQLTKVFQTVGFSMCAVFCCLCGKLAFKFQQELLTLFADDLPELRAWVGWFAKIRNSGGKRGGSAEDAALADADQTSSPSTPFDDAVLFFVKTIHERCTLSWLALLRQLPSSVRLAVVRATEALPSASLKQLARFYETTGASAQKYLELHPALRLEMTVLLNEFPMATLQTLFAKFNTAKLIGCVLTGLAMLPRRELLRLVDALSIADSHAIAVFAPALFAYKRAEEFSRLFLTFSTQNQIRFLDLLHATATTATAMAEADSGGSVAAPTAGADGALTDGADAASDASSWVVFDLFLDAHFNSYDTVVQKLSTLPSAFAREMIASIAKCIPEELSVLGEGIESISTDCLAQFLRTFSALPSLEARQTLVKWVHGIPGDEAMPVYETLLAHLESAHDGNDEQAHKLRAEFAVKMLNLVTTLTLSDKKALCQDVLLRSPPAHDQHKNGESPEASDPTADVHALNESILRYLCDCTIALHKAIKLFRIIPSTKYGGLIFLLRTQRIPEQVALSRLMLSLSGDANCRLLEKVHSLPTDVLDLFFELLLLIPQIEYRMLTKLLISPNVSPHQLLSFIQVAASLMNQASSRELVIFTAELPAATRNLFFDMLAADPVKGVLLRIVACSSKLPQELLHQVVALLHPMSWGTRSSFVEQIRALESTEHIQDFVEIARDLSAGNLQIMVLLFNILQVPVRICFVTLFMALSHQEKHLALGKLNALPKDKLQTYCSEVCDLKHPSDVGSAFFRVFGILDIAYQLTLLDLLQRESCWPLISLMADCVAKNPEPSLINGFAASLVLLTHEAECLALRSVVEEALANATSLDVLVLVLCHFRTPPKLLEFLKFVHHLSRFARPTVFFRVLSRYKQTVFIYEMCRMLDLDDALFALKRLDRLSQRCHDDLDSALETLSASFVTEGVAIKGEFCNIVLGFHERRVKIPDDPSRLHSPDDTRYIVPRTAPTAELTTGASHEADAEEDDEYREVLFVPSSRPMSHPAVSLERHLRRAQSEDTLPQKRRQSIALHDSNVGSRVPAIGEVSDDDPAEILAVSDSASDLTEDPGAPLVEPELPADTAQSAAFDSSSLSAAVFTLTESVGSLPPISANATRTAPAASEAELSSENAHGEDTSNDQGSTTVSSAAVKSLEAADPIAAVVKESATPRTLLPPLVAPQQQPHQAPMMDARPRSSSKTPNNAVPVVTRTLSRSESAPTTIATPLEPYTIPQLQKPKRYRGLVAALGVNDSAASNNSDDALSGFHVGRDRGASIFRKECELTEARGPSRIRVAKTLAAQSHVMAVRVQQALGKREQNHHAVSLASPLLRPDRHTLELAHAAMAAASQARESRVHGDSFCRSLQFKSE